MISFTIKQTFNCSAEIFYNTWLSSKGHTDMTGGSAEIDEKVGTEFSAWDGYISGKNLELIPQKLIKQSWRTSEFQDSDPDSLIELTLQDKESGCVITLTHSAIPDGQPDYEQGWKDHYFTPMDAYFR